MMRAAALCFLVVGFAGGCESTVDPRTGETSARFNMPGTEGNRANLERQWQQCTRFTSQSVCRRRLNWSPPPGQSIEEADDDK